MDKQHIFDVELKGKNLKIEIDMYENRTILTGDSGTGKSFLFDCLRRLSDAELVENIVVADYRNHTALDNLQSYENKLICIDNCDILLDDSLREHIVDDINNHYLLAGRDFRKLLIGTYNIGTLGHKNNKLFIEYPFVELEQGWEM